MEKKQTYIQAWSGIRGNDPSVRAGEHISYVRPRGQFNLLIYIMVQGIVWKISSHHHSDSLLLRSSIMDCYYVLITNNRR
jgi:hypothetical protein